MKIRITNSLLNELSEHNITINQLLNYYYVGTYKIGNFEYAENRTKDEHILDSLDADAIDLFGESGRLFEVDGDYKILKEM